MKKIIIFLIRKKLGVKEGEKFYFKGQKSSSDRYFFTNNDLLKKEYSKDGIFVIKPANVSLHWILDDECEIIKDNV